MISKKSLLLITVPLFLLSIKDNSDRKTYSYDEGTIEILNGHVKQIRTAPLDDRYSTNPGQDYSIIEFDKQGNVVKSVTGFHGSIFTTHYTTLYGADGKKLKTKGYIHPEYAVRMLVQASSMKFKKADTICIYKYNKHNKVTTYVSSPGKSNVDSNTYKYNNYGQLIEFDNYTPSKELMDVTKYKYDTKGNLVESDKFHWKRLMVRIHYNYKTFDLHNNWIDVTEQVETYLGSVDKQTLNITRQITYY